jgi:hypothetical protein
MPALGLFPDPVEGDKATILIHTFSELLSSADPKFTVAVVFEKVLLPVIRFAGDVATAVKFAGLFPTA